MDITELTNEDLDQLRIDVLAEQDRRSNQLRIPEIMTDLVDKYVQGGGDRAELIELLGDQVDTNNPEEQLS